MLIFPKTKEELIKEFKRLSKKELKLINEALFIINLSNIKEKMRCNLDGNKWKI